MPVRRSRRSRSGAPLLHRQTRRSQGGGRASLLRRRNLGRSRFRKGCRRRSARSRSLGGGRTLFAVSLQMAGVPTPVAAPGFLAGCFKVPQTETAEASALEPSGNRTSARRRRNGGGWTGRRAFTPTLHHAPASFNVPLRQGRRARARGPDDICPGGRGGSSCGFSWTAAVGVSSRRWGAEGGRRRTHLPATLQQHYFKFFMI